MSSKTGKPSNHALVPRRCRRPVRCAAGATLLMALLTFRPAAAAISYVQGAAATGGVHTTVKLSYSGAQHAGDVNIVFVGWLFASSQIVSVTDSQGNAYTLVNSVSLPKTAAQAVYYAKNIAAAGSNRNTVSVTFSRATTNSDVRIMEYSGLDPNSALDG